MKITFTAGQRVQTNGTADFFRLLSTVGPVTVEFYYQGREIAERVDVEGGFAEQFKTVQFDRVDIFSATAQTVQWETALGSEIRYDRGAATINGVVALDGPTLAALESVDLNAATLAALEQIDLNAGTISQLRNPRNESATGFYRQAAAMSALTIDTMISPGSNTNGVLLLSAGFSGVGSTGFSYPALLTKSSPPANHIDGEVYMTASSMGGGGAFTESGQLHEKQLIPAGQGLYFINQFASSFTYRYARWRIL
jgi:hypothetical protein